MVQDCCILLILFGSIEAVLIALATALFYIKIRTEKRGKK